MYEQGEDGVREARMREEGRRKEMVGEGREGQRENREG